VFAAIAIGTFVSVVDSGSVLVALPEIEGHFGSDLPTVQWVVVGNALAISALILPMGRLGDIAGRKWVYIGGLAIFVAGSLLAGLAVNLPWLISAKVFQGFGSAMIQGNGMATVISSFSGAERGKALGTHMSVVGSGAIAGPAIGGLLVASFGWQSVFFVNVPAGILTIVITWLVLRPEREAAANGPAAGSGDAGRFDWVGAGLSAMALLVFLLVVSNGHRMGWTSPAVLAGAAATAALLAGFVWWELRTPSPMLELRLFKRKLVAIGAAAAWLSFMGMSSSRFMMPFYLQRVLEISPRDVGLLLIPPALCMVLLGPVSGRLSDRFGWRALTVSGLALSMAASIAVAVNLTESSPAAFIVLMLMGQSAGMALFNSPNQSSLLSAVERNQYGVVSALTQLIRNSANVTSIAVATTVVVVTMGTYGVEPSLDAVSPAVADAFVAGLRWAFILMAAMLLTGVALAVIRGERQRAEPTAPPRRESAGSPAD
jgi:EmrB/QacA subfamily drug resistance transporter